MWRVAGSTLFTCVFFLLRHLSVLTRLLDFMMDYRLSPFRQLTSRTDQVAVVGQSVTRHLIIGATTSHSATSQCLCTGNFNCNDDERWQWTNHTFDQSRLFFTIFTLRPNNSCCFFRCLRSYRFALTSPKFYRVLYQYLLWTMDVVVWMNAWSNGRIINSNIC